MALEYFLYNTNYNNTLVERSNDTFAPLPPNTGEILIDFFIPEIQPLYLYRESGGTIVYNNEETVLEYIHETSPAPTTEDNVTYGVFTGTTAILSATTNNLQANKVNVSGDTMTGTLSTSSNLYANGAISGLTLFGGSCVTSPIISASTCLCSVGETRLVGVTTAASILNVSGETRLAGALSALSTLNVSGNTTLSATARSVTPITTDNSTCIATTEYVRNYLETLTGGSTTYFYDEKTIKQTTTSASCIMYFSGAPWNFVAGRYVIDYSVFFGNSGTNGCTFVKFGVDDIAQGNDMMMRMTSTAATLAATISRDVTLTDGCHCLTVHFWRGSGTACVDFASIRARRIG